MTSPRCDCQVYETCPVCRGEVDSDLIPPDKFELTKEQAAALVYDFHNHGDARLEAVKIIEEMEKWLSR